MHQALGSVSPAGSGRCIWSSLHLGLYLSLRFSRAQHHSCYSSLDKDKLLHSRTAHPFDLAVKSLQRLGQTHVEFPLYHLLSNSGKAASVLKPQFLSLKNRNPCPSIGWNKAWETPSTVIRYMAFTSVALILGRNKTSGWEDLLWLAVW